jgi:hypothetical protein
MVLRVGVGVHAVARGLGHWMGRYRPKAGPIVTPSLGGPYDASSGAAKVMPDGRQRFGHGIAAARERRSSQARCDTTDPYVWRLSAVCRSRDCNECSGEKQGNTFGRLHGKLLYKH